MTQEEINNLLCDLRDIRNVLLPQVLAMPKDNEGSEFTIKDILDDAIELLEAQQ